MQLWESDLPINDIQRYSRQIILPNVKIDGQRRLDNSKVLIVGMGGLGSPVLMYLATTGIRTIGIMDFDKVELHNLQRQVIYKEKDVGRFKTECAKEFVMALNSTLNIKVHNKFCDEGNVLDIIKDYDIIADCCDDIKTRYVLNDACRVLGKDLVSASVLRWEGQIFTIPRHGACFRCMFPEMKTEAGNCNTSGVMGPVCGIVGSIQATEIVKLILSSNYDNSNLQDGKKLGKILLFNGYRNISNSVEKLYKICQICETRMMGQYFNKKPPTQDNADTSRILPWSQIIKDSFKYKIVDIRTQDQYKMFRVSNSVNIPNLDETEIKKIKEFEMPVVVSCYKGCSSLKAADILRKHGIEAYSSKGGIEEFKDFVGFYEL